MCPLCDQENETADHLCLHRVFAQEVWVLVAEWYDGAVHVPGRQQLLLQWWNSGLAGASTASKSRQTTIRIYTARNIWKERNRIIFESTTSTPFDECCS
jgi:hypothetical protein